MEKSTFEKVSDIILDIADNVEKTDITNNSNIMKDLDIDSLDMLEIMFAVDKGFGIKIPLEAWSRQTDTGEVEAGYYWRMDSFCNHIDRLVADTKK